MEVKNINFEVAGVSFLKEKASGDIERSHEAFSIDGFSLV